MLTNSACFCHRVSSSIMALASPLIWAKASTILGWVTCRDKCLSKRVLSRILFLFHLQISNSLQRFRHRKLTHLRVSESPFHLLILPTCLYHNFVPCTLR